MDSSRATTKKIPLKHIQFVNSDRSMSNSNTSPVARDAVDERSQSPPIQEQMSMATLIKAANIKKIKATNNLQQSTTSNAAPKLIRIAAANSHRKLSNSPEQPQAQFLLNYAGNQSQTKSSFLAGANN